MNYVFIILPINIYEIKYHFHLPLGVNGLEFCNKRKYNQIFLEDPDSFLWK